MFKPQCELHSFRPSELHIWLSGNFSSDINTANSVHAFPPPPCLSCILTLRSQGSKSMAPSQGREFGESCLLHLSPQLSPLSRTDRGTATVPVCLQCPLTPLQVLSFPFLVPSSLSRVSEILHLKGLVPKGIQSKIDADRFKLSTFSKTFAFLHH